MLKSKLVLSALVMLAGIAFQVALDLSPAVADAAPLGYNDSKKCRKLLNDYAKKPKQSTLAKIFKQDCQPPTDSLSTTSTVTSGTSFVVNSTADERDRDPGNGVCEAKSGQCTLRAAIMETNERSGQDTITLPAGTFRLDNAGRDETKAEDGDLNIRDHLIINGAGSGSTVIDGTGEDRVFDIRNNVTVKITGVTITNGRVFNGDGAGIRSDGNLTLEDVIVRNNTTDDGDGGGISVRDGNLTITNSTIESNSAVSKDGGGIDANGTVSISSSLLNSNSAGRDGGGIHLGGSQSADLRNLTIVSNRASSRGGGISSDDNASVVNATITGNTANIEGGGIYRSNGNVNITNTILSNNSSNNCAGGISSGTSNLDSGTTCGFTGLTNTDPRLGSLASNGGNTQTMAPQSGSPAIDGGTNTNCPSDDQRGQSRPFDGNNDGNKVCDIGAVEVTNSSTGTVVVGTTGAAGSNCSSFSSQANAQAFLRANPSDPLLMDNNRNGIACESADGAGFMNGPFDYVPVTRTGTTSNVTPGANCTQFTSQASAQSYLRQNPSDPLLIDNSRNGIACEGADGAGFMSSPFDYTVVPR